MVLVRFAYGFLDRLVPCSLYRLCPFAPPPITGASSLLRAAVPRIYEPFPAHAAGVLTNLRRPDGPDVPSVVPLFPAS